MINSTQDTTSAAAILASQNAQKAKDNPTASAAKGSSDTQDRFLKLLVTQMKNQDPLNPLDNAQVTSQMAQLSTVSGIDKLNSTLQALSDSMAVGQSVSATSMIGRGVLVPGSTINLAKGQAIGGMDLAQPADNVSVTIQDAAGNTVRTLQFGEQKAGVLPFAWDGTTDTGATAADGAYKFTVDAVLGDNATNPTSLSFGTVGAVTPGAQGATLDLGPLGGFALSSVKQVM